MSATISPDQGNSSTPEVTFSPALRRQRGFSLVELWVSILIIGTMAGLTVAAFQRNTQMERLNSARDEFLEDIRAMQSNSVSGRRALSEADGTECTATGCGGYGVYLVDNQSTYTLFQDYSTPIRQYTPGSASETLEVKSFPTGIRIEQITYVKCGSYGGSCFSETPSYPVVGSLHIYFAPHFGTTTFTTGTDTNGQQVRVQLRDTRTNMTLEFTVDRLAGGIRE